MNSRTEKSRATQMQSGGPQRKADLIVESPLQAMADGSLRVRQLMHQQRFAGAAQAAGGTVQLLTSAVDLTQSRLGAVAEVMTPLKPWDDGEFYARDRSNARKDHVHAHVWKAGVDPEDPAKAIVEGHVVTAKGGEGKDRAKRNLTKHWIVANKTPGNRWNLAADRTEKRAELPGGSPEVAAAAHDAEDAYTWGHVRDATRILLNMPDGLRGLADEAATEISDELAAEKEAAKAKKIADAKAAPDSDEEPDMGLGIFS